MPSLDFVYDLVEKLEEDNIEYLVLTLRQGKTEDKVDVLNNILWDDNTFFYLHSDKKKCGFDVPIGYD